MPGAAIIEVAETCQVMTCTRPYYRWCPSCKRATCEQCAHGAGCLDVPQRCHPRPDGDRVR